jgi:hypothetical protein
MPQALGSTLARLGLSQYLDVFIEHGFDSWETVLDVTEADLCVLAAVPLPPPHLPMTPDSATQPNTSGAHS